MREKPKSLIEGTYPVFITNTPASEVTVFGLLEYKLSLVAVRFKNWWFDNCFGIPYNERNIKTRLKFIIGLFIIHRIFGKYSFSKYKKIK